MIAAIYARYSSDKQRDESIEIQVEQCTDLIKAQKGWTLGEVYADRGISGRIDQRPDFQRCITDAEAGRFQVLVVYKYDRFARNVMLSRMYKERLIEAGVELWSVREGKSTDTPDGFLHSAMDEVMAEYYSRNLAKLVADGMKKSAEKRKACGRRIYGYTTNATDEYIEDAEKAPIVQEIFKRYLWGQSVPAIVEWLNEQGYRTNTGSTWSKQTVSRLLRNDAYIGVYRFNGIVDRINGVPPIVDYLTFQGVQDRLNDRHSKREHVSGANFLLTGKLYCANDLKPLHGVSGTSKNGDKYTYYRCGTKGGCGVTYPQAAIEREVLSTIKSALSSPETIDLLTQWVMDYAASLPSKLPDLRKRLAKARREEDNLANAVKSGAPYDYFAKDFEELRNLQIDLLGEIALEQQREKEAISEQAVRECVEDMVDAATHNMDEKLVQVFIDRVFVTKEQIAIVFALEAFEEIEWTHEVVEALLKETPHAQFADGVLVSIKWWCLRDQMRTHLFASGKAMGLTRRCTFHP